MKKADQLADRVDLGLAVGVINFSVKIMWKELCKEGLPATSLALKPLEGRLGC